MTGGGAEKQGGAQISEPAPKVKLTKAQARKAAQVRHTYIYR